MELVRRPTVLVVDDDPIMRHLARESLEPSGFEVAEAGDGAEALDVAQANAPDLILLDVKMPRMDGFTACRKLRESTFARHTPILMMTGLDDLDSIREAYSAGATDFTIKPINWLILGHRAEYMLRSSRSAKQLRKERAKLEDAQRIAGLGYWESDPATGVLSYSGQFPQIFGLSGSASTITRETFLRRIHSGDRRRVEQYLEGITADGEVHEVEYRVPHSAEIEHCVHHQAEAVASDNGRGLRISGTVQDITERRRAEEQIQNLAYYDGLTGLPNRASFRQRLELALSTAKRHGRLAAALFIDLDRFQRINDTLGHSIGDELLSLTAERLLTSVRFSDYVVRPQEAEPRRIDLVARFGGDEFVLLLSEISQPEDAALVAERISETLAEPFELEGNSIFLTASVGISIYPNDGVDAEAMVQNADTAMHHAKASGGNRYQYYSAEMNNRAMERLSLESELKTGLERDEFVLHYQPQFDMSTGSIIGAEALVRWNHPQRGLVAPGEFIPLAEETGLIVPLGDQVLQQACEQAVAWREAGLGSLRMSVNLSVRQFARPNLVEFLGDVLTRTELEPKSLSLELTESTLMRDVDSVARLLNDLKGLGVHLSLDDFGTGYSSLSYLMRFPLDTLKIDRSFLTDVPNDPDHVGLTRAIIAMASNLHLHIVAEGVETEEQLEFLRREGCTEMQGFLLSRPVPADEVTILLRRLAERDGGGRLASAS